MIPILDPLRAGILIELPDYFLYLRRPARRKRISGGLFLVHERPSRHSAATFLPKSTALDSEGEEKQTVTGIIASSPRSLGVDPFFSESNLRRREYPGVNFSISRRDASLYVLVRTYVLSAPLFSPFLDAIIDASLSPISRKFLRA